MEWFGADSMPPDEIFLALISDLKKMAPDENDDYYRQLVISDCYLIIGMLENALEYCPRPQIEQQWTLLSNRRLNLLSANGKDITSLEVLSLFPKRLTKYGINHLKNIACIIEDQITDQTRKGNILQSVIKSSETLSILDFPLFNGTLYSRTLQLPFQWYDFAKSDVLRNTINEFSRLAENILREESGLPMVGEGWIAETQLHHQLQMAFPDLRIEHHFSPVWLGRQHLDVYFPDILVAVEYQGPQHNMPVEYFGGVAAFKEQLSRDRRKKTRCSRNGVKLILVEAGYSLSSVVQEIRVGSNKGENR